MSVPLLALLLAGCGGVSLPPLARGPVEVTAEVAAKHVDEGEAVALTVEADQAEGWQLAVGEPVSEGLEVRLDAEQGPLSQGDRTVHTWQYSLTGPAGSYVIQIPPAQATSPDGDDQQVEIAPIFVDIGVDGPLAQGLSDFEAPPPPAETPWLLYSAIGAGVLLLAAAVPLVIRATRKPAPPPPPVPPHVAARHEWQEVRSAGLDDHPQAVALSRVLRTYFEAITGWPATMRTGPEILAWLEEERIAGATARVHASHILSATDRLKFAREGGGADFFAQLDDDFDRVIEATRPAMSAPEPPVPEGAA